MVHKKRFLCAFVLLMIIPILPGVLSSEPQGGGGTIRAGTVVLGNITTDTLWDSNGSPYFVTGNLTVLPGATLRILPGVTVNCSRKVTIRVLGGLIVEGEEGREVVLQANGTGMWEGIWIGGWGWMNHTVIRETHMGLTLFNNSTFWVRYTSITPYTSQQITCTDNSTLYLLATPFNENAFNITSGRVYERNPLHVRVLKDSDMSPFEGAMVRMWGDGKLFFASEGWGGSGPKTNSSGIIAAVEAPYRNHEGRLNLSAVSIRVQAFAMDVNHTWTAVESGIIADQEKTVTLLFDFTPPPMPQNFTAGNVTGHTIDLFWELNHPDAAQIQILMNTTAGPNDFTIIGRALPQDSFYRVEGLAEETTYYFRMRSADIVPNYSPFTPVISATTLDVTPPEPPENLRAVSGEDFLLVEWDPSPSDDVMNYSVHLNPPSEALANLSSGEKSYNITGLLPDTEYTLMVVAWDDAGLPSAPALLRASTLDTIPPPAPVLNYTFLGVVFLPTSGIVNLSGVLIRGRVPGEKWALVEVYRNDLLLLNATAHLENFTVFVNFVPGVNVIRMRAMDPSGNFGPFSEELTFRYDPYPPEITIQGIDSPALAPYNLSAEILTEDSSPIYSLNWSLEGEGFSLQGSGEMINAQDLQEGTYLLTVWVRDVAGNLNVSAFTLVILPPDTTPPQLVYSSVEPGQTDVPLNATFVLRFNEAVILGEIRILFGLVGEEVPLSAKVEGETVTITPLSPLSPGTLYHLVIEGLKDEHGNTAPVINISFTTVYPVVEDYDSDGLPNSYEERYSFLDPLNPEDASRDEDGDGLTNLQEYLNHTRPDLSDTDGDGYSDLEEIEKGTDPNNKNEFPAEEAGEKSPLALYAGVGIAALVVIVALLLYLRAKTPAREELEEEVSATPPEEVIEHSLMDDFVNCPECGAPVEKDAEYCPECGAILKGEE
ncbi:MAG: Ig-like domain-containing protein [Thermoplasmata archaeon]|nr:Ig-like domain-containing protein [Thermoplasmata archaeon]